MAKGVKTGGRQKGSLNKTTTALKDAILNALDRAGGEDYLLQIAKTDPKTFAMLIGRVLPLTVAGDKENPLQVAHSLENLTDAQLAAIATGCRSGAS